MTSTRVVCLCVDVLMEKLMDLIAHLYDATVFTYSKMTHRELLKLNLVMI